MVPSFHPLRASAAATLAMQNNYAYGKFSRLEVFKIGSFEVLERFQAYSRSHEVDTVMS